MLAIGGPNKAGIIVTKMFSSKQPWTVSKDDVVFGETFLCKRRGRDKEDMARSKSEEKQRTMSF